LKYVLGNWIAGSGRDSEAGFCNGGGGYSRCSVATGNY